MKRKNINVPLTIKDNLIEHINLNYSYYRMRIKTPQIAKKAKPGKFVMLSIWKNKDPFLKRPFSFHKKNGYRTPAEAQLSKNLIEDKKKCENKSNRRNNGRKGERKKFDFCSY